MSKSVVKRMAEKLNLPTAQKKEAREYMDFIRKNPTLQLTEDDELVYKGRPVRGSNIADIVGDLLAKQHTGPVPKGATEFVGELKRA